MYCCGWMGKVVVEVMKTETMTRERSTTATYLLWKCGEGMTVSLGCLHLDWKELKLKLTMRAVTCRKEEPEWESFL